jgi:uncharacterized membrane protein
MAKSNSDGPEADHWESIGQGAGNVLDVRRDLVRKRGRAAALVDNLGRTLASPAFFWLLVGSHLLWVLANLPLFPWKPWDPYPFTFLATVASVEAPFLSVLILMHQRRQQRIGELREEINLQLSLHVERQSTMTLRLLNEIQGRLDMQSQQDRETLRHMMQNLDPQRLMDSVERRMDAEEGQSG